MRSLLKIHTQKALERFMPKILKNLSTKIGLTKFIHNHFLNKYESEMAAKIEWGKDFRRLEVQLKAKKYWKDYRFLDELIKITEISNESIILDVGCGIGSVLHFLPGKEKIGIDPLAKWYKKFYPYPASIKILESFGENLDFSDKYFTHVFCTNVLDHVTAPDKVLGEIKRVLRDDGYFVLTVETHDASGGSRGAHHPHTFTITDIRKLLDSTGFQVIFERETRFLGMQQYSLGLPTKNDIELIFVLRVKI